MSGVTFDLLEQEAPERRDLYQQFVGLEEEERISFHYENDPEFLKLLRVTTGGPIPAPLGRYTCFINPGAGIQICLVCAADEFSAG